jgi:hypothetical protein
LDPQLLYKYCTYRHGYRYSYLTDDPAEAVADATAPQSLTIQPSNFSRTSTHQQRQPDIHLRLTQQSKSARQAANQRVCPTTEAGGCVHPQSSQSSTANRHYSAARRHLRRSTKTSTDSTPPRSSVKRETWAVLKGPPRPAAFVLLFPVVLADVTDSHHGFDTQPRSFRLDYWYVSVLPLPTDILGGVKWCPSWREEPLASLSALLGPRTLIAGILYLIQAQSYQHYTTVSFRDLVSQLPSISNRNDQLITTDVSFFFFFLSSISHDTCSRSPCRAFRGPSDHRAISQPAVVPQCLDAQYPDPPTFP